MTYQCCRENWSIFSCHGKKGAEEVKKISEICQQTNENSGVGKAYYEIIT